MIMDQFLNFTNSAAFQIFSKVVDVLFVASVIKMQLDINKLKNR